MINLAEETFKILKVVSNKRVLVIGDVFLDEYVDGQVKRISTGVSIPIIEKVKTTHCLGGAGNIALNISSISSKTFLLSRFGKDDAGRVIDRICSQNNITCYKFPSNKTIVKQRIYLGNQQVSRIDDTNINGDISNFLDNILEEIKPDILVVADYLYGIVSQSLIDKCIKYSMKNEILLFLTSREINKFKLNDYPIIVGNEKELNNFLKKDNDKPINNIFVTMGEKGIYFINKNKVIKSTATSKSPLNVSGAGDSVLALISLFYGEKISIENILYIANVVGGIAIENRFTYVINKNEILEEIFLRNTYLSNENKVVNLEFGEFIISFWKERNQKISIIDVDMNFIKLDTLKILEILENEKLNQDKLVLKINFSCILDVNLNSLTNITKIASNLEIINMIIMRN